MTHEAPPPRLRDTAADDGLRRDLAAAAAFDAGYDVESGAARFEAAIADVPPGPDPATTAAAAGGKAGVLTAIGIGIVVAAGVWAFAGDLGSEPERVASPLEAAAPHGVVPPPPVPAPAPLPPPPPPPSVRADPEVAPDADDGPTTARERTQPRARDEAPKAPHDDDALAREMAATHAAKRALKSDPARALKLARAADAEFPDGPFAEDREGIEILALYALGDRAAADRRAERFLAAHPHGTYAARVKAARDEAGEKP